MLRDVFPALPAALARSFARQPAVTAKTRRRCEKRQRARNHATLKGRVRASTSRTNEQEDAQLEDRSEDFQTDFVKLP